MPNPVAETKPRSRGAGKTTLAQWLVTKRLGTAFWKNRMRNPELLSGPAKAEFSDRWTIGIGGGSNSKCTATSFQRVSGKSLRPRRRLGDSNLKVQGASKRWDLFRRARSQRSNERRRHSEKSGARRVEAGPSCMFEVSSR